MQAFEVGGHLTPEAVKMPAALARFGESVEKQIHQPGFSPAHAAPDIQPLDRRGARAEQPVQKSGRFMPGQRVLYGFQWRDGAGLRGIGAETGLREFSLVTGTQHTGHSVCSSGRSRKYSNACGLASASVFFTGRLCTTLRTASSTILPLMVRGISTTWIILAGTCRGVVFSRIRRRISWRKASSRVSPSRTFTNSTTRTSPCHC